MIRLQALAFILQAIAQWALIAVGFVIAALKEVPSKLENYENLLIYSVIYLIIGLILYARSKSLAGHFVRGVSDEEELTPDA